ncbi:MAG: hypothetical protein LUD69_08610 [Oscillospiraceae bacterium]|nr:hypothetical protein [Oscillospiraceae bacterium]
MFHDDAHVSAAVDVPNLFEYVVFAEQLAGVEESSSTMANSFGSRGTGAP